MYQGQAFCIPAVMDEARESGLFVSLATFSEPPTTQGPTGNPTGPWTPITGLIDLPCMDAPERFTTPTANEQKSTAQILSEGFRHVLLDRYYPSVFTASEDGWRVTIDDIDYDVLGAEADSQRVMTRLRLQRVEF